MLCQIEQFTWEAGPRLQGFEVGWYEKMVKREWTGKEWENDEQEGEEEEEEDGDEDMQDAEDEEEDYESEDSEDSGDEWIAEEMEWDHTYDDFDCDFVCPYCLEEEVEEEDDDHFCYPYLPKAEDFIHVDTIGGNRWP